jgi:hypothetical protein
MEAKSELTIKMRKGEDDTNLDGIVDRSFTPPPKFIDVEELNTGLKEYY